MTCSDLEIELTSEGTLIEFGASSRQMIRHSERRAATERRQYEVRESVGALHAFVDLVDHARRERVRGLGLLALLNVADVVTTSVFIRMGVNEGNPALSPVAMRWWLLLALKAVIMAIVAKFVLAAPARSTLARRLVNAATAYYFLVVVWNVITIIRF